MIKASAPAPGTAPGTTPGTAPVSTTQEPAPADEAKAEASASQENAPPEPIFQANDLTLGYGRKVVLSRLNFEIRPGEFWCLLGSNGAGKTTLIKALLGALRPKRGQLLTREEFRRKNRVGYVPQQIELNATLPTTVTEFVQAGLVGVKTDPQMRRQRMDVVIEKVGLKSSRKVNFWALSGGQQRRALVARALIRNPQLLIVDEPIAGLDFAAAEGLMQLITELNQEIGITVVFVTHDLQLAADRSSHVAMFRGGEMAAGPTDALLTSEELLRTYGVPVEVRETDGRRLISRSTVEA